jgi:hypothetical protein
MLPSVLVLLDFGGDDAERICLAVRSRENGTGVAAGARGRVDARPRAGLVLLPPKEGETKDSPAGYLAPLRQALIDDNRGHVNLVVCESDYRALKRGIHNLPPGLQ